MKAFRRIGLLAVVAVLATAAMATSAPAVTINPDNTAVSGLSTDSSLSYGVATIRCDTATADGTTGLDSDRITDLTLTFTDNCAVVGVAPAEVTCGTEDVTLIAQADTPTGGSGTVRLEGGSPESGPFQCVVTTTLCTVTVAGPQDTQNGNTTLNESTDVLSANVNVQATRTGSALCGPTSGTANFTANYATTPSDLTIDP
jgi:hypothetical protein